MFERAIRPARGPFARSRTIFVSERAIRGLTGAVARSDRPEGSPRTEQLIGVHNIYYRALIARSEVGGSSFGGLSIPGGEAQKRARAAIAAITRESWLPCQAIGEEPGGSSTSSAPAMLAA